ncbi:MAG: thiosulfate oxidation carrier protein SoxY [Methyloligellaceae bacterium]
MRIITLSRREFFLGVGAAALLAATLDPPQGSAKTSKAAWEKMMEKITGGAKPADGKIALTFPETPQSGESIPFQISVNHPMAPGNHVKAIHVLATEKKEPQIASFFFSPESGSADVSGRIRLNREQDIVAIAILSTGESFVSQARVQLLLPCCEAPNDH